MTKPPKWHRLTLICLTGSMLSLFGCGIYLHDENLQKQTTRLAEDYKGADVVGAIKAVLEAQAQLDKREVLTIAENETAERERAIALLISSYPKGKPVLERLNEQLERRTQQIIGNKTIVNPDQWRDFRETRILLETSHEALQRQLLVTARAYKFAGGQEFTSCEELKPVAGLSPDAQRLFKQLLSQCGIVASSDVGRDKLRDQVRALVNKSSGELIQNQQNLDAVTKEIQSIEKDRTDALQKLKKLKEDLKAAQAKDPSRIDKEVLSKLQELDKNLKEVDSALEVVGADFSIGKVLAAVEFRKTNLREILAATQTSGDGTAADSDTAKTSRAIVGVIAGLIKLEDATSGRSPTVPALAVAVAFQDGLEKAIAAKLAVLKETKALLEERDGALLREIELLADAQVASGETAAVIKGSSCAPIGFNEIFKNSVCVRGRESAARAISAYNLSWATGRSAARIAYYKITHSIAWEKLRISQEAAIARVNIQTIAVNELAAYGAGGVKPETIAAFLDAIGIAVIAGRVK